MSNRISSNKKENEKALELWTSLLDKGYKISATYGRDWHREENTGHYGCTYLDVDDISAKSAMRAIRLGKTVISHGAKFIFRVHRHGVTSAIGDTVKKGNYTFSFFTDLHSRAKNSGDEDIVYNEIKIITNGGKCVLQTLSNEILKQISPNYDYDKYKSEAHYIYQKEYTSKNTISVYLRFYTATYSTRYGYVKDESAWISDAKIDLKLNNNSDYSVVKFTAAQDGTDYLKSIKKMFSNDVYTYYFENNSNTSLQNQELAY